MSKRRYLALLSVLMFFAAFATAAKQQPITISPSAFDFGWCPDNAKISADFIIKNIGVDLVPITSVQPTCGCTASNFTPGALGANEEKTVSLTFNTRGYNGMPFNKSTRVKTDSESDQYSVMLSGFVNNPNALVAPEGNGIASFTPAKKSKSETIKIVNKGQREVSMDIVQKPASWATVKLKASVIQAGQAGTIEISVDGSLQETRETSVTLSAFDGTAKHFMTVAIRTGEPPVPPQQRPVQPAAAPAPNKTKPAANKPAPAKKPAPKKK